MNFTCASQQGVFAESIFITQCIKRNLNICNPITDLNGIDFVVEVGGKAIRVQVKSTNSLYKLKSGESYVKVSTKRSGRHMAYNNHFDVLAVYIISFDCWYIIKATNPDLCLRINPNSSKCKYYIYKEAWHLLTQDTSSNHP